MKIKLKPEIIVWHKDNWAAILMQWKMAQGEERNNHSPLLERNKLISLRWSMYKFSAQIKEWLIKAVIHNLSGIRMTYVCFMSFTFPSSPRKSGADCAMSVCVPFWFVLLFFFFLPPFSHLCSQDDLMTDLIAGARVAGKMFSSLSLVAYCRRAFELCQTYGPTLVPGLIQKGLESAGWSVSVSAVAPCCISKLLHHQASNSAQTSFKTGLKHHGLALNHLLWDSSLSFLLFIGLHLCSHLTMRS